ncbi:MAG: sigma-54-dependent Fis family transcriptional regulator [Candidatus Marinimicrobia bacterium]|nr:sigma-54-dependent Fis family transcriptional regulator [Candidatus Neomarinimicrobiota bacterium]
MIDLDRLQKASGIIGNSDAIKQSLEMMAQVAPVDISVLVTGESGTGKEIVAKGLHKFSKRAQQEMVTVNCGAIPAGIIESELFGHKKGAYTGAGDDRKGYFETAHKGTVFLDEIGEMPLETQVKLLRVLDSGEFMRVGESKTRMTDVRILAATNKNLSELVQQGKFRQDLYFRLKTVTIDLPTLRQRIDDLSLLVERFALEFTRSNDIPYKGFMPEAIRRMKQYDWPGNVRELKNFVESILVMERGERITVEMVEQKLGMAQPMVQNQNLPMLIQQSPEQAERELILRQLFLLRQDVETIKAMVGPGGAPVQSVPYYHGGAVDELPRDMQIDENIQHSIRNDAIGDMNLEALEKEAISRTLQHYNNNRRAAAKSLGMSERTLYRKIDQYDLGRKIKRSNGKNE